MDHFSNIGLDVMAHGEQKHMGAKVGRVQSMPVDILCHKHKTMGATAGRGNVHNY